MMHSATRRATPLRLLLIRGERRVTIVDELSGGVDGIRVEIEEATGSDPQFPPAMCGLFDAVLYQLDRRHPFTAGTLERLHRTLAAPIIVLSLTWNEVSSTQAIRHGAQDFVAIEQSNARLLLRSIQLAIERHRRESDLRRQLRELHASKQQLERMVPTELHFPRAPCAGDDQASEDEARMEAPRLARRGL